MDIKLTPVLIYRWIVFLLAGGYSLYQIFTSDYTYPGGPFRFLTIWALLLSFFCASRMLAITERRSTRDWAPVVGATAVLNAMVVLLYWRLYFIDPSLVNSNKEPVWHQEYYLHLIGPILQWIDMLFIWRGFRRYVPAAGVLVSVTIIYILWTELILQNIGDRPLGTATSGLPYPFLNDMEMGARLVYYGSNVAVALVMLALFWGLAVAVRRLFRGPALAGE